MAVARNKRKEKEAFSRQVPPRFRCLVPPMGKDRWNFSWKFLGMKFALHQDSEWVADLLVFKGGKPSAHSVLLMWKQNTRTQTASWTSREKRVDGRWVFSLQSFLQRRHNSHRASWGRDNKITGRERKNKEQGLCIWHLLLPLLAAHRVSATSAQGSNFRDEGAT